MKLQIASKRLILHPGIYYRTYDDLVILYHTGRKEVFTFNATAVDIFDCFSSLCSVTEAIVKLTSIYRIDDEDVFEKSIIKFTCEAIGKGIIVPEYKQTEISNNLESEISKNFADGNHLYSVTIELTHKCNEKCRHCYISADNRKEMTTQQVKFILDELADLNVLSLVFTGGELFTRKDAFEILDYDTQNIL